jgi:hypothetical protein
LFSVSLWKIPNHFHSASLQKIPNHFHSRCDLKGEFGFPSASLGALTGEFWQGDVAASLLDLAVSCSLLSQQHRLGQCRFGSTVLEGEKKVVAGGGPGSMAKTGGVPTTRSINRTSNKVRLLPTVGALKAAALSITIDSLGKDRVMESNVSLPAATTWPMGSSHAIGGPSSTRGDEPGGWGVLSNGSSISNELKG